MEATENEENRKDLEMVARAYQVQLEDVAASKNTIIHLPTGSGKTFIAIQLIKRFRVELQKPWGQGGKRTFFLVNNVPLVEQQRKVIQELCPVKGVGGYSGEDILDYWNKAKWDHELSQNQVIVMTCQILVDMITHYYIKIEDINLMIFDECHHAVDDHPMRLIMKHFADCPVDKQPKVLGLTATLLNANATTLLKVEEDIKCLETTFHATIATAHDIDDVFEFSTNPLELVQYYHEPKLSDASLKAIRLLDELIGIVLKVELPVRRTATFKLAYDEIDITSDPKKIVKFLKNCISGMIGYIQELGAYGGSLGILAYVILVEKMRRKAISSEEELLYTMVVSHCIEARDVLEESMESDTGLDKIRKHSSEQVLTLLDLLKEYNPKYYENPNVKLRLNKSRKPLAGIIFTKQRFTSKLLYNIIKELIKVKPEDYSFIKHDFLVGFAVKPGCPTREDSYTKKCSEKVLLNFSNRRLNLIISTSVIEEGVDIPQCGLVVRFDSPSEYRSYIQSKGRARSATASFVMFIKNTEKEKFLKKYKTYQAIESHIKSLLAGKTQNRLAPTAAAIKEDLYEGDDIPPFINPYGGRLSAVQAIGLLNRYCSMLPHDQFTIITPMWVYKLVEAKGNDVFVNSLPVQKGVIKIVMPISCPLKEPISGMPCFNIKNAKRSAALNVCKRLHEIGELEQISMLPRTYGTVEFEIDAIKECFLNWPWGNEDEGNIPKSGTKRRIRKCPKVYPKAFKGPSNWNAPELTFYLHIIEFEPAFEKPIQSREGFLYDLLKTPNGYGLLTANKINEICDFPLHMKLGEIFTSIKVNYKTLVLKQHEVKEIIRFHLYLFKDVLNIVKEFLVFDGKKNCIFVTPTIREDNNYRIDWDVINKYRSFEPFDKPSYEQRKKISSANVTKDNYKGAVVYPWYRTTMWPDRYIVTEVLETKSPRSQFCGDDFDNYEEYYMEKHCLELVGDPHQPLLEVISITSRYTCIPPHGSKHKSLTQKQLRLVANLEGEFSPKVYYEVFVPEFCTKFEYPGMLWYKANMIPSVVHRVTALLNADDLRRHIAREAKLGMENLPKGKHWQALSTDMEIARQALLEELEPPSKPYYEDDSPESVLKPETCETNQPNACRMKEAIYEQQQKKLDKQYPWDRESEPLDIERNITTATLMDIELYTQFVTTPLFRPNKTPPHNGNSPKEIEENVVCSNGKNAVFSNGRSSSKPVTPPPAAMQKSKIILLSKTNTGIGPELKDVIAALTTIKSHDTFNLERAETLGDSFLKFAATLYLFHKFPELNEGQLTNIKGRLIGNRNLFYAGERINLGGLLKVDNFAPRLYFPLPGFSAPEPIIKLMEKPPIRPSFMSGLSFSQEEVLTGVLTDETWRQVMKKYREDANSKEEEKHYDVQNDMQCYVAAQAVADKSVADCVEALIGTYLLSSGIQGAVGVLEWLRVLPKKDNFTSYLNKPMETVISQGKVTRKQIDFYLNYCREDVENILNYTFKDSALLLEALSHASYIRNRATNSYERLEFLGDAILDFLITSYIFENSTKLKPGDLTDLRSSLVNNVTFASYVVKLGLHKFVGSDLSPHLMQAICKFVEHQEQRNHEVIEDVLYLISEEDCLIADYVEVPKVLSDIFEALAGAIYLDSGGNLQTVWDVYYRIMWMEIEAFSNNIPKQPVRVLYEMVNAKPSIGTSMVTSSGVPKVMVPITVTKGETRITVHGFGNNKFQAKRAAAKLALSVLKT